MKLGGNGTPAAIEWTIVDTSMSRSSRSRRFMIYGSGFYESVCEAMHLRADPLPRLSAHRGLYIENRPFCYKVC
jgi:hypothetical protein